MYLRKFTIKFNTMSNKNNSNASGGMLYGLGFIGSAIYFISASTSFWGGVVGFLKAIVWPAYMAYEVFKYIGA